jgi:hypothetical protein
VSKQTTWEDTTDNTFGVFVSDTTSTTGGGLSGLSNTTPNLVLEYRRQGQNAWTSIPLVSGATLGSFTSGGIVADGSLVGAYEIGITNDAFVAGVGVRWVLVRLRGAANMLPVLIEFELKPRWPTAAEVATAVWAAGTRTLTSFGTLVSDVATAVWAAGTRTLTAFGFNVTVGTNNDKTGYSLATAPPTAAEVATAVWAAGTRTLTSFGTLVSDVATAVWAAGTRTLTAFGFNVTVGTNNDKTGYSLATAPPTADQIKTAVWSALSTDTWPVDSFGRLIIISDNNNRTVKVLGAGAGHIAADVHAMQIDVITAAAVSAAAVTKIQTNLATSLDVASRASQTSVDVLLGRITSTVYGTFQDLAMMITNDGTASAQWSSVAMQNIPVAGGSGARTVTITVRDPSANPIQNATVRLSRTGESFALQTNASGVATFSLDDATWSVAITATGFSFTPTTLVVGGNVSQTYSMTAAGGGVSPSDPPFCTGYWTVYNQNGTVQSGAQVSIQASSPPPGSTGIVMEDAVRTGTADNNGVVQFSNLIKGATYIVYRTGSSRKFTVTVPTAAGSTAALGSIVG